MAALQHLSLQEVVAQVSYDVVRRSDFSLWFERQLLATVSHVDPQGYTTDEVW